MSSRFERQSQKELNDKHTQILKQLMARPENRKCADCRKKDPRWASWNIGIFVCIQCSGIHRSIGTHISKVKSADLDTWNPEQVEANMVKWGNAKANLYWEHEWPKDMQPSDRNMDQFIRAKYERKQYAMKGEIPDPSTLGSIESPAVAKPGPPVAIIPNTSQQLFQAFGDNSMPSIQTNVKNTTASATQQLFDAFSSPAAPEQNSQKNIKDSILSLYGNPQQKQITQQQCLPGNSNFARFQEFPTTENLEKTKPFDPFGSIQEPMQGMNLNSGIEAGGSQKNALVSGTASIMSQPSRPAKFSSIVNQTSSTSNAVTPSQELFDAFAPIPSKEATLFPGLHNNFSSLPNQQLPVSNTTNPPELSSNHSQWNNGKNEGVSDDFGDFTQFSVHQKHHTETNSSNQPKIDPVAPVTQDGWAGWEDQTKSMNFQDTQVTTNSEILSSPMQTLPASSRNASNVLDHLDLTPKKPMSFDSLPPAEDGWGGFQ